MFGVRYSNICLFGAATIFAIISKLIFDKVYITSKVVVDEEFHLVLGKAYCKYEFDKWHPKVTTFPGLYIVSSVLLGFFHLCSIYWLRFISLAFSCINIFLFYFLLNESNDDPSWKNIISSVNLSLLPPLYFFSHLYYTDVPSVTMILLLFIFNKGGNQYLASIFGMLSVLFRQTNIIWVGMAFGCYILKELNSVNQKRTKLGGFGVTFKDLIQFLKISRSDIWSILKKTQWNFWLNVACYGSLLFFFVLFVYFNGSIVVGDKSAHEATVHIPQVFYFSLFCCFFSWPHFITEIPHFLRFINNNKIFTLFIVIICLVIVHFNTLVHPYMLADNRHYIFYIWNRFYGKYVWFRYFMVPIYLFSLYVIANKLWNRKDVTFLLFFIPCTLIVLVTQKLLEFRYFFIPFILFRTQIKNTSFHSLLYEFLTYCVLNVCTFYLFFTKTIEWIDFDYAQRLIW